MSELYTLTRIQIIEANEWLDAMDEAAYLDAEKRRANQARNPHG